MAAWAAESSNGIGRIFDEVAFGTNEYYSILNNGWCAIIGYYFSDSFQSDKCYQIMAWMLGNNDGTCI